MPFSIRDKLYSLALRHNKCQMKRNALSKRHYIMVNELSFMFLLAFAESEMADSSSGISAVFTQKLTWHRWMWGEAWHTGEPAQRNGSEWGKTQCYYEAILDMMSSNNALYILGQIPCRRAATGERTNNFVMLRGIWRLKETGSNAPRWPEWI